MTPLTRYEQIQDELRVKPLRWLVTGCAGFIGSHLLEKLLLLDQTVVGLDNFSTGRRANLEEVRSLVSPKQWTRFDFREGDIRRLADCHSGCAGVDFVLHQAALGSVPRSVEDPLRSHAHNVDGTINILEAARVNRVRKFVYASSSSVYGDHPDLPKVENKIGNPLSPYAATKRICELYAEVFTRCYSLSTIGLRYFNVFGPRQDPAGQYAAVIPRWFAALLKGQSPVIHGDGETSRDFCYIANVVQANLLSAADVSVLSPMKYNVACGERTTLNELFKCMQKIVARDAAAAETVKPQYQPNRLGDIRHSLAEVGAINAQLGYVSEHALCLGLEQTYPWYREKFKGGSLKDVV
jgi:UDP-N-acetylglucosamine 4-epimerase